MQQRYHPSQRPQSSQVEVSGVVAVLERCIDVALIESFPASDAPYRTLGTEAIDPAREFGSPGGACAMNPPATRRARNRASAARRAGAAADGLVLTVGHSTRSTAELIDLLKAHGVQGVVDVRTVPRSRTNPQFNRDSLRHALGAADIGYRHAPGLGGLRRAKRDSPNTGWHNASFRGFADYMQTLEFAEALQALIEWAWKEWLALMCAEAVPWRCHRSLIADALTVRGVAVEHIIGAGRTQPHALTPWASVKGTSIVYPLANAEHYEAGRVAAERDS